MKVKIISKKNIFRLLGLFLLGVALSFIIPFIKEKIRIANLKDTASPNIQTLKDFVYIKSLDRKRTIWIYLPPGHDRDSIRYPVLYMLDGDNLFNDVVSGGNEWQVDEVIDQAIAKGDRGAIVVAIDDAGENRNTEYKPFDPETQKPSEGSLLLDYISQELKPQIDHKYKTLPEKENTLIAGCSLGGIMALYGLTEYQEVFGSAALFSPSLWVSEYFYELPSHIEDWSNRKVYISVGDSEGFMDDDALKLHQKFLAAGIPEEQLKISIEKGFGHYHLTWRQGFSKAYPWIVE